MNKKEKNAKKEEHLLRHEQTIFISMIFLFIILVLIAFIKYNKPDKKLVTSKIVRKEINNRKLEEVKKQILGITDEEIEKEKIDETVKSDEYKKYDELDEEIKNSIEAVPRKEKIDLSEMNYIKKRLKYKNTSFPKKYNLVKKFKINPLNQGSFELSWAFSSIKSLETNINIKNKNNLDLSEIHLDYMESNLYGNNRNIHRGGNFSNFENYSINQGAVLENDLPYKEYIKEELNEKNKIVTATETINYPSEKEYKNKNEYINILKKHLMTNGSLYSLIINPNENEFYNEKTNSLYFNGDYNLVKNDKLFHCVSIVGWDDNYKKDNFKIKPKKDGAFIALNSWGSEFGDNGLFYISYEDFLVTTNLSGVINTTYDMDGYIKISDIKTEKIKNIIYEKLKDNIKNIDNEDYISKLALNKINELDLSNSEIKDENLDDIKIFRNVKYLNLSNNKIKNISKLKYNYYVTLDLSNNKNIKGLESLNVGYSLLLKNNNITSLPLTLNINEKLDLSNNKNIKLSTVPSSVKYLNLSGCNIYSLADLPKLSDLEDLNLSNNKIKNVAILNDLSFKNTANINLSNNKIEDISILNPINAYSFDLSNNNIKDIRLLDNDFTSILNLSNNKINDLSYLKNLENLDTLILKNMKIKDINKIKKLKDIKYLDLSENEIKDTSLLSDFKKLKALSLSKNKDIKINFKSDSIKYLNIEDCNINDFDINNFKNLKHLNISFNNIENISNEKINSINLINN